MGAKVEVKFQIFVRRFVYEVEINFSICVSIYLAFQIEVCNNKVSLLILFRDKV